MERIKNSERKNEPAASFQELVYRELLAALVAFDAVLAVTVLAGKARQVTGFSAGAGETVRSPWLFAGVQLLLHYLPPLLGGVGVPLALVAFLFFFPYLGRGNRFAKAAVWLFWLAVALMLLLTAWGNIIYS